MRDEADVAKGDEQSCPGRGFEPGSSQIHVGGYNCWAVILEKLAVTELINKLRLS